MKLDTSQQYLSGTLSSLFLLPALGGIALVTGLRAAEPDVAKTPAKINIFVFKIFSNKIFLCRESYLCCQKFFCRGIIGLKVGEDLM